MRTAVQKMIEGIMKNVYKDNELLKAEVAGTPDAGSLPLALAALGTTPTRQPQRAPPSRKSQPAYLDHSPDLQNA